METKEVLIIGGGIAGLSTGIHALKSGYKATIVESHDKPGGQLTAWWRKGYKFDYCLQWLMGTNSGIFNKLWYDIGAINSTTAVTNHDIFCKIAHEEMGDFFFYSDLDRWEAYLKEMAPEDSKGIHKLCNMIKGSVNMEPFENPPCMRSFWDYVHFFLKSWRFLPVVIRYGKSTTYELFEDLELENEKLKGFLCNVIPGMSDFPALAFMMMIGYQHSKNAGYLKGGSAQMCRRVADTFKRLGGNFRFNANVEEIIVEDGVAKGVKLENGENILADHIVSACDGHTVLYDMLGGKYVPPVFAKAYEEWPLFVPLVMVSFGIDKAIVSEAHNTAYSHKTKVGRTPVKGYNIMNRSMYDNTMAPKGKTALLLSFESPWEIWKDLSDKEYIQEKKTIQAQCIELLEKQYAGISEYIEIIDVATPQTTVRYTGVWKGAYEGFQCNMDMLGDGLPTELEGLANFSMAGQWLFPGGGLPPSALSGRWVIQKLAEKHRRIFRHHISSRIRDLGYLACVMVLLLALEYMKYHHQ